MINKSYIIISLKYNINFIVIFKLVLYKYEGEVND